MSYGFVENKFYIDVKPLARSVKTPREEFTERAFSILNSHEKVILSFSGGTDSQATYLAFKDAGVDVPVAFMHMPGYNDNEWANVQKCKEKWKLDLHVTTIDPYTHKEWILAHSKKLQIPPNQILHSLFLQHIPEKYTFIEGFNGPDPYVHNGKHYLLESANSVEYARLRAYKALCSDRTVVGFEKDEYILASILKDGILTSMCYAWDYYKIPTLSYEGDDPISIINYWDLFVKPTFYGKNWADALDYFPKSQGCEKIDFIINGMEHDYRKNNMFISIEELLDHFDNGKETKRYWQRNPVQ